MAVFLPCVFARSKRGDPREELKSLAGVGVADSEREEAEPKDQHDNVQHGDSPSRPCVTPARCRGGLRRRYGNVAYGPGLGRISAPEVPLDAYVFEAIMMPTL